MSCFRAKKRSNKQKHPHSQVLTSLEIKFDEKISIREDTSSVTSITDPPPPYEVENPVLEIAPRHSGPLFEVSPDSPTGPPSLITIPATIHRQLFKILADDPATSLCLALTCKRFYVICEAQHGHMKVDLNTYTPCIHAGTDLRKECGHKEFLYQYVEDWMPEGYYFEWRLRKFIPMSSRWRGNRAEVIDRAWDYAEGIVDSEEEDRSRKRKLKLWKKEAWRMVPLELN